MKNIKRHIKLPHDSGISKRLHTFLSFPFCLLCIEVFFVVHALPSLTLRTRCIYSNMAVAVVWVKGTEENAKRDWKKMSKFVILEKLCHKWLPWRFSFPLHETRVNHGFEKQRRSYGEEERGQITWDVTVNGRVVTLLSYFKRER